MLKDISRPVTESTCLRACETEGIPSRKPIESLASAATAVSHGIDHNRLRCKFRLLNDSAASKQRGDEAIHGREQERRGGA